MQIFSHTSRQHFFWNVSKRARVHLVFSAHLAAMYSAGILLRQLHCEPNHVGSPVYSSAALCSDISTLDGYLFRIW